MIFGPAELPAPVAGLFTTFASPPAAAPETRGEVFASVACLITGFGALGFVPSETAVVLRVAAAAGALPVSATRGGLDSAGLADSGFTLGTVVVPDAFGF